MTTTIKKSEDEISQVASGQLDQSRRSTLGQFMTSSITADFMASLFRSWPRQITLLDPGTGTGSLTEAFARRFLEKAEQNSTLEITAYEIEPILARYFRYRADDVAESIRNSGHTFLASLNKRDFIDEAAFEASFNAAYFTHIILNPPYRKLASNSMHRKLLHNIGIEAPNLYVAFLALSVMLAKKNAEIVAIIPRSFCNGLYFRPFREWLLGRVAIEHIHIFESRKKVFKDDNILQENIIVRLVRDGAQGNVTVSKSFGPDFENCTSNTLPFPEIVDGTDSEKYIRIPTDNDLQTNSLFASTLKDLGLEVSTGQVVDFRFKNFLVHEPTLNTAPLLYSHHFIKGQFQWPKQHKKPNALIVNDITRKLLMPKGWYVLTKRFSSKEEKRRVVAYIVDPTLLPQDLYAFENHLNVVHANKQGLDVTVAYGLALFLNSSIVDKHFRTFSGHTQVNATDLRGMRFPAEEILRSFGEWAQRQDTMGQEDIDGFIATYAEK